MGTDDNKDSSINFQTDFFAKTFNQPEVIMIIVCIISFILLKLYLGNYEGKSLIVTILETIIYLILGLIIFFNLVYLTTGVSITSQIFNIDTNNPTIEIDFNTSKEEKKKKSSVKQSEVFHVSGNKYTYEDAEPICKAYGARVANYDDIERAYNNGAEWCGYGWSEGQMAFFPTQKSTWNKLQDNEETKNNCGRPGINGGYFENPNIRFGVNCYGVKPDISNNEKCLMDNTSYYDAPITPEENAREIYWNNHIDKLLLSPFKPEQWSRY